MHRRSREDPGPTWLHSAFQQEPMLTGDKSQAQPQNLSTIFPLLHQQLATFLEHEPHLPFNSRLQFIFLTQTQSGVAFDHGLTFPSYSFLDGLGTHQLVPNRQCGLKKGHSSGLEPMVLPLFPNRFVYSSELSSCRKTRPRR